jgi:ATP-dependent DNA helicase RecG
VGRQEAYRNIHFPNDANQLNEAQYRLKFEELFFLQLKTVKNQANAHSKIQGQYI